MKKRMRRESLPGVCEPDSSRLLSLASSEPLLSPSSSSPESEVEERLCFFFFFFFFFLSFFFLFFFFLFFFVSWGDRARHTREQQSGCALRGRVP